jgi:hypothetical protein
MNDNSVNKSRKGQGRSPSYPGIDIETAIERAKTVYQKEGRNSAPPQAILKHWGYAPKSSSGLTALAALKKFGLTDDHGTGVSRRVKLSELALKIILDPREDSPEKDKAIKEAALNPEIHRKILTEVSGDISDDNLKYKLLVNENFTDRAVNEFIPQFRKTISFANLTKDDNISGYSEDKKAQNKEQEMETIPEIQQKKPHPFISDMGWDQKQAINFPIKISEKMTASLQIQCPMEEEDLRDFLSALEALKPGILQSVLDEDEKPN